MHTIEEFSKKYDYEIISNNLITKNVKTNIVTNFIDELKIHEANRINYFEKDKIIKFIHQSQYEQFDVLFITGVSKKSININSYNIHPIERSFDLLDLETIRISGKHRRLGGKLDTKNGLTNDQILSLGDLNKASNSTFMIEGRNPLLLIYPLKLKKVKDLEDSEKIIYAPDEKHLIDQLVDRLDDQSLVPFGIGIGFPFDSKNINKQTEVYAVAERTKWWHLMNLKDSEEDE
jgi:hypothetical protein